MASELTPLLKAAISFAYIGGALFVAIGSFLSFRRGRPHPLLLVCISAISFSWIEAPYDWAVYAQFPPAIPRMPSWWPLNMTWGGLPASVPPGYIAYFVLPAVMGASMGRWLNSRFQWRAPITLLTVGLVVGCLWAFAFNAILGRADDGALNPLERVLKMPSWTISWQQKRRSRARCHACSRNV